MKFRTKRLLTLLVGWAFIVVGIAGLFLPVIQGILCLIIGLIILSSEYVWAHRLLQKLKQRFPKIARASEQATEKAQEWLRRISGKQAQACKSEAPRQEDPEKQQTVSSHDADEN